jgi:hypothetical protein
MTTEAEATNAALSTAAGALWEHFFHDVAGMHPYVACIGVSPIGRYNDTAVIHVMLVRKVLHHERQVPTEWQGFPVQTKVTGRPRLC